MKRTVFVYLCGLLSVVAFYACKPSDKNLQKEVDSVLIAYPGVMASVNDAVVTLTGSVATEDVKTGAERATRAINHIKSVNNNIMVNAPMPPANMSVDSDFVILEGLNARFADDGYHDVRASVVNGEVTLTGNVKRADLEKVMQLANESDAKRVVNQLTIIE